LNVLPVTLPPLRERPEDVPPLMAHFFERYFRKRGENVPEISDAVTQAFTRYNWPGNVRELENACERIAQTCTCGAVRIGCVSATILFRAAARPAPVEQPLTVPPAPSSTVATAVSAIEPKGTAPIALDDRLRE